MVSRDARARSRVASHIRSSRSSVPLLSGKREKQAPWKPERSHEVANSRSTASLFFPSPRYRSPFFPFLLRSSERSFNLRDDCSSTLQHRRCAAARHLLSTNKIRDAYAQSSRELGYLFGIGQRRGLRASRRRRIAGPSARRGAFNETFSSTVLYPRPSPRRAKSHGTDFALYTRGHFGSLTNGR